MAEHKIPIQSLIDHIKTAIDVDEWAKEMVENLLKEQETVVRCKDCKHLIDHYGFMDDGYCKKMREDYNSKFKPKKDWFCADGKRR